MPSRSRILIAEDHKILREGLRALLTANPELEVIAEAENGRDVVQRAAEFQPDLILMDLSMPGMNGVEAIREIRSRHPKIKILVLTVHSDEEYVHACVRDGADGYIVKDASRTELVTAIRNVLGGKRHFCSEATDKIISWCLHSTKTTMPSSAWESLTHRERQILKLIAEGKTNKGIGGFLAISTKTVEKHRANLMGKLGLHSTATLTAFAMKKGLIDQFLMQISMCTLISDWFDFIDLGIV
jgi:DNA-binding NarL/FixJ family response regulator